MFHEKSIDDYWMITLEGSGRGWEGSHGENVSFLREHLSGYGGGLVEIRVERIF